MPLAAQDAPAAAAIAALGAVLLAVGLRRSLPLLHEPLPSDADDRELFAATLRTAPREAQGYVIAVSIYLAGFALNDRAHLFASGLLALSAFLSLAAHAGAAAHAPIPLRQRPCDTAFGAYGDSRGFSDAVGFCSTA